MVFSAGGSAFFGDWFSFSSRAGSAAAALMLLLVVAVAGVIFTAVALMLDDDDVDDVDELDVVWWRCTPIGRLAGFIRRRVATFGSSESMQYSLVSSSSLSVHASDTLFWYRSKDVVEPAAALGMSFLGLGRPGMLRVLLFQNEELSLLSILQVESTGWMAVMSFVCVVLSRHFFNFFILSHSFGIFVK